MYITIQQALDIAIEALSELPESEINKQAIIRLSNLKKRDFCTHWTKDLVFQRLDQWKEEHGRNPTITNLAEPNMPKVFQIQRLFDMRATAFFNIYYPSDKPKKSRTPYTEKTREEYIDLFIKEYNRIKPHSSKDYNCKRNAKFPTWNTIARYVGVTTWNELLKITNVDTSHINKSETVHSFNVKREVELYDKLIDYLDYKEK